MDLPTSPTAPSIAPNAASAPAAAPAPAKTESSQPKISSDFDTFLRMLTAQISNQDPLDPMKSEEFAVQLATFSGVEQQVKSNELLESLLSKLGGDQFAAMSTFIGREARATMPARYDGQPIQIDPEPPITGARHEFVVKDAGGTEIYRRMVDSTGESFLWNGEVTGGGTANPGTYSFAIDSFDGDALVATESAAVYARVNEVRQTQQGAALVFAGGVEIASDAVTALREVVPPAG